MAKKDNAWSDRLQVNVIVC